jgi:hypothetical protein
MITTSHRLIRCKSDTLLREAAHLHQPLSPAVAVQPSTFPSWRYPAGNAPEFTTRWRTQFPGGSAIGWCLEVEQGANGVLAHLSAAPLSGPLRRVPDVVSRRALRALAWRELGSLARLAEVIPPT